MENLLNELRQVCDAFSIEGNLDSCEEIKCGNINRTYKVNFTRESGEKKSYIVQAVNTYVFKEPIHVMDNIDAVTEHIRKKNPDKTSLHFHHTKDRKTYLFDKDGFWRLFNFIPSKSYNICDDLEVIRNAGDAFGEFQMDLADFDATNLYETIPDFHNTRKRFATLWNHVKEDSCGRVKEVEDILSWLREVEDQACVLTDLYEKGELPLRVTHNDTKINNVLFEQEGKKALVVIDLDTVMPGLVGNDFGDAIRFAANYVEEDCSDYEKSAINMDVFRAFTEGFLSRTKDALTENEINTLAASCFALTTELVVRFLDDYICGDPYFKINYPEHNLVRTKCQTALAKSMLSRLDEMEAIVKECL